MASLYSGQITVTTAGTEVGGPASTTPASLFAIKAHPDNTDTVWIGNDGSDAVDSSTGFPLNPGEGIVVEVDQLSRLKFDSDVNGAKICWFKLR